MPGFAKASDLIQRPLLGLAIALGLGLGAALGGAERGAVAPSAAPARVVSVNLCTDQLAMLLAAPGQLVSVSALATDPRSSAMAGEAAAYPANHAQAEEVFLMHPDLVLAGSYTSAATVDLLRRLGVTVVQFAPARSLADVQANILAVGRALGRDAAAEALSARFQADLAALRLDQAAPVSAALYYPNGYTTGAGTLADDILQATGFRNIGAEAGVTGGGTLPLERLVMAAPAMIVTSASYPGASRSEDILTHPALLALRAQAAQAVVSDADWVCGTPKVLRAVSAMAAARNALGAGG